MKAFLEALKTHPKMAVHFEECELYRAEEHGRLVAKWKLVAKPTAASMMDLFRIDEAARKEKITKEERRKKQSDYWQQQVLQTLGGLLVPLAGVSLQGEKKMDPTIVIYLQHETSEREWQEGKKAARDCGVKIG